MKFCVNCGEKLLEEKNFCSKCGQKQPDLIRKKSEISLIDTPNQVNQPNMNVKYFKNSLANIIGYIIIIAALITLFVLYVLFQDWLAILWPYIIAIVIISWVIRFLIAGFVVLSNSRKDKNNKKY